MGSLKTISFVSKVCFVVALLFVCGCETQYAEPQQQQPQQQQQANKDAERFLMGGLLGMAASGAGDIGDPRRDLALRGAASGLQNAQQNEAIRNSGQVNVNVNNTNQPAASDPSIHYVKDQKTTDGKTYTGQFKLRGNGLYSPHGQGVMTSPTGEKYEGEWKDSYPDGQGVYTWPSGERYDGEFKDGKFNGQGVYTLPNGEKYVGEFKDGKRNGQGVQTWPTGERYDGEFKDDKQNGFGKKIYADGRTEEGAWRDDKFVGSQSQVSAGDSQKSQGGSSKFGFVNVTADDPTFEVFADGAFVGNSPAKLKLSEGPHTIEVRKEGFKDYKKEIRVTDGSELNLMAVLEKQ